MHFTKQEQLVLIFIIVTIVIGGGVLIVRQFHPAWFMGKPDFVVGDTQKMTTGDAVEQTEISQQKKEVVVHVTGAVQQPDVYKLEIGARVMDAIQAAGGATEQADLQQLNLAKKVVDGEQIYVPDKSAMPPPSATTTPTPATAHRLHSSAQINLNTATAKELEELPGIGPVMAQRIIEYRTTHGPFYSIAEIQEIRGIGAKTFEKIKEQIVVY